MDLLTQRKGLLQLPRAEALEALIQIRQKRRDRFAQKRAVGGIRTPRKGKIQVNQLEKALSGLTLEQLEALQLSLLEGNSDG